MYITPIEVFSSVIFVNCFLLSIAWATTWMRSPRKTCKSRTQLRSCDRYVTLFFDVICFCVLCSMALRAVSRPGSVVGESGRQSRRSRKKSDVSRASSRSRKTDVEAESPAATSQDLDDDLDDGEEVVYRVTTSPSSSTFMFQHFSFLYV